MSASAGFLFPGQLSEWVGMGKDFLAGDPEARTLLRADLAAVRPRPRAPDARGSGGGPARQPRGAGQRLPRLGPRGARARAARRRRGGDGGLQPRQLRRDGRGRRDLLRGSPRRARRRLGRDRAPGHPRPHGRRHRRAPGDRRRGMRGGARSGAAGVDRQRQRLDPVRPDGIRRGRRGGARGAEAAGALGAAPDHELADSQRAHAARRGSDRADDRGASNHPKPEGPVLRPRRPGRRRRGRGAAAARNRLLLSHAVEGDLRGHGRGRPPRPAGSRARGSCSRGWRAGSIGPRGAWRPGPSRPSPPRWI